jgi:glycosyltransferase involved in cell wall biosynthesis
MASALVECAAEWQRVRLVVVNTAYVDSRDSLVAFSVRKVALLLKYVRSVVVKVRKTRAEVVILTPAFFPGPFLKDAIMISSLKMLTSARVVAWVHMDPARLDLGRMPRIVRWLARGVLARVDAWVACAPSLIDQWPPLIPQELRRSVANGIPESPELKLSESSPGTMRVCFVSSLEVDKGWIDLLEAADEVCESRSDVEFHFFGDPGAGWTAGTVAQRFSECRFSERIQWHGPVAGDELWQSFASADLFCFPSRTEQLPVVVLEAMSTGLPIVATDVGAVGDAVVDGKGGWLVQVGSHEQLVGALRDALDDPERLARFGRFNAERQRQLFSLARFGAEWEQLVIATAGRS